MVQPALCTALIAAQASWRRLTAPLLVLSGAHEWQRWWRWLRRPAWGAGSRDEVDEALPAMNGAADACLPAPEHTMYCVMHLGPALPR